MEQLYILRESLVGIYKRFETAFLLISKFFAGLLIFIHIAGIGAYMPVFGFLNSPPLQLPYILLMAALFTITPMTVGYGLIILNICIQTSSALGITAFIGAFLLLVLFFYARLASRENFLILATYLAFQAGVPYLVPILAGLYLSLTSVIPIAIGVIIWSFIPFFGILLNEAMYADITITDVGGYLGALYTMLFSEMWADEGWIFTAFIFVMVTIVVFAISRFSLNYVKETAIAAGVFVAVVSLIIAHVITQPSVLLIGSIFSAIVSGFLAYVVSFFDMVLDYQRLEKVQFEDEHNFYQVRIIPKISVSRREHVLKHINPDDGGEPADYSPERSTKSLRERISLNKETESTEIPIKPKKATLVSQDTDTAIVIGRSLEGSERASASRAERENLSYERVVRRRQNTPSDTGSVSSNTGRYGSRYARVDKPEDTK